MTHQDGRHLPAAVAHWGEQPIVLSGKQVTYQEWKGKNKGKKEQKNPNRARVERHASSSPS